MKKRIFLLFYNTIIFMKNFFIFSVSLFFLLYCSDAYSQLVSSYKSQIIFNPEASGYFVFRIPSIVVTKKGGILTFAEGRKGNGGDWDPSNIVMRTSQDNGSSWSEVRVIADYGNATCSNAVPIIDYFEDKIHLIYTVGYSIVYYACSIDEGQTWQSPINITAPIQEFRNKYNWRVVATGPGHGTQLTSGRLLVPIWFSDGNMPDSVGKSVPHHPSITSVLYSDDFGQSWNMGDIISPNNDTLVFPNEANCVELADGTVMFNMRNESINYRRIISYSSDGISKGEKPFYSDNFFEPICHASMIRYSVKPYQSKNRIIFTNPDSRMSPFKLGRATTNNAAPKRERSNLTLRISYDEGLTFPIYKTLDEGVAAYSDMAVDNTGIIHCLYEKDFKNANKYMPKNISLLSFDLGWATNGKDLLEPSDKPLNSNLVCASEKYNSKQNTNKKKKSSLFRRKSSKIC